MSKVKKPFSFHNVESITLDILSPNITMIKSKMIRWTGHVAQMERDEKHTHTIFVRKPERKTTFEGLRVSGKSVLKCFLKK
jgi:hypothetical protein